MKNHSFYGKLMICESIFSIFSQTDHRIRTDNFPYGGPHVKNIKLAILGATGAVGREMLKVMEERKFPFDELRLLSGKGSAGKTVTYQGKEYTYEEATDRSFEGMDIVFGAVANAYAHGAKHLVAGKYVKIRIKLLHVNCHVGRSLGSVRNYNSAVFVGKSCYLFNVLGLAQHV